MADLIAQGTEAQHRWRRTLPQGSIVLMGRQAGLWSTPWDDRISREHARLWWDGQRLNVEQTATARNPIFFGGQAASRCQLTPGQHFVIGQTTFALTDDQVQATLDAPPPEHEQTFSASELRRARYRHSDGRMEILGRLPDVISGAASDSELLMGLVNLLLAGIPRAGVAALVSLTSPDQRNSSSPVRVLHWDRRLLAGGGFEPSQRLIVKAIESHQSILHEWHASGPQQFTASENVDWAFCTPVQSEACPGWGIYVTGRLTSSVPGGAATVDAADLRDDVKFAELVASTLGALRQVRALTQRQASLSQFFAPVVLEALAVGDADAVLAPREADVAVMFCDLRGFSLVSEQLAGDLLGLLRRVSDALGVMTRAILEHDGVVGDFQGDSAMGFWGWPLVGGELVARACRAALAIRAQFEAAATRPNHPLANFRVGIGIATGRGVAGKIGTVDQVKVTVFGPVVNLASRLEGMTKIVQAPILVDRATAEFVRANMPRCEVRCRRVAVVRPLGMDRAIEVTELLAPASESPSLTDEHIVQYEAALDAFTRGQWPQALEILHQVPADDRVKDFLMSHIARHHGTAPQGWNGVIALDTKD